MSFFKSMWIAISTYSILPSPHTEWNKVNMRYSVCFLPVVGAFLGGALLLWHWVCRAFSTDGILFAAVAAVLPLLLTGGIHMDGFMDTIDALASHQSREKKLAIMKDSHCGAFSVMYCCLYLLLAFGLYHALYQTALIPMTCLGFFLSRAFTAFAAFTFPNARVRGCFILLPGTPDGGPPQSHNLRQ